MSTLYTIKKKTSLPLSRCFHQSGNRGLHFGGDVAESSNEGVALWRDRSRSKGSWCLCEESAISERGREGRIDGKIVLRGKTLEAHKGKRRSST